ncbi:uncharacterized protein TrAtP1_002032 [Trichoderma atroviride]|uniref:uncharacterized protein n=1 Tax=Hypocrea atroviridis TaxID=63577 RepID=UPI0033188C8A|nr:hypothetical protein TrAtP1_002032 [Trichoderma atroviride]
MPRPHHSTRAETRWAVRIIPLFIVAVLGVATYSVVARLCISYLYHKKHQSGVVTAFLVLYFLFFLLMAAAYLRTFFATQLNPGLVPLSSREQIEREAAEKLRKRRHKRNRDVEESAYVPPRPQPGQPGAGSLLQQGRFRLRGRRPS